VSTVFTESDLRDLLDHDSADTPPASVTATDVHRRARRIRRRRLSVVMGVALTGLVVAGFNAVHRTEGPELPEDIWAGVMAQPTPSSEQMLKYTTSSLLVSQGESRGGVVRRFNYRTIKGPVLIGVTCGDPNSYAVVWVNGLVFATGPCGPTSENPVIHGLLDDSGSMTAQGLNMEVLIVQRETVPSTAKILSFAQAQGLIEAAKPYHVVWNLMITGLKPMN
jgi:hypothetical protein